MVRKIKKFINKLFSINQLIDNQNQIKKELDTLSRKEDELLKALIFNNTISDSKWLKFKSFSPGGWAVDYAFLYTLYRVLNDIHPILILEFGLGQSSKLIHQYANFYEEVNAITCEHDYEWINFFKNHMDGDYKINIKKIELKEVEYNSKKTLSYNNIQTEFHNEKFDLIVVDAPFGSPRYSRPQILDLAKNNLADSFCIIIDDYDRKGEQETANELMNIFESKGVKYSKTIYGGSKQHFLICDEKLKFLTTL